MNGGHLADHAKLDTSSGNYYDQSFDHSTILVPVGGDYTCDPDPLAKMVKDVNYASVDSKAGNWDAIAGVLDQIHTHLSNALKYVDAAQWKGQSGKLATDHLTQMKLSSSNSHDAGKQLATGLHTVATAFKEVVHGSSDASDAGDTHWYNYVVDAAAHTNTVAGHEIDGRTAATKAYKKLLDDINKGLGQMPPNLASNVPTSDGSGQRPYPPDGGGLPGGGGGAGLPPGHLPKMTDPKLDNPKLTDPKDPKNPPIDPINNPPIHGPKDPINNPPIDGPINNPIHPIGGGGSGGPGLGDGGGLAGLGGSGGGLGGGGLGSGGGLGAGGGSLNGAGAGGLGSGAGAGGALGGGGRGAGSGAGAGGASGGSGGISPGGMGGGGGGGGGNNSDRDRNTWLTEDDDVWGRDQGSIPGIV